MNVPTITPKGLDQLRSEGKDVELIDVRTPNEYREIHVAYARNLPLDRLDPAAVMQARNGAQQEPLYLICRSGSRGQQAFEKFLAAGYARVVNVEGGTLGWVESGLPVVLGKKALSLDRQVRIAMGLMVLLGVVLGLLVHPAWIGLSAFVGAGMVYAGITDSCPMALLIARLPWNRLPAPAAGCCVCGTSNAKPVESQS